MQAWTALSYEALRLRGLRHGTRLLINSWPRCAFATDPLPHVTQVTQLPLERVLLALFATAQHDIWGAAGRRVLAVQGHPEMRCSTALDKILPAVKRCAALRHDWGASVTALRLWHAVGQPSQQPSRCAGLAGHGLRIDCCMSKQQDSSSQRAVRILPVQASR